MGLIDVLTQYDTKKKAAHAAKTVKHGVSSTNYSLKSIFEPVKSILYFDMKTIMKFSYPFCFPSLLQAGAEISTVHPEQYAKRFRDFIANIFA